MSQDEIEKRIRNAHFRTLGSVLFGVLVSVLLLKIGTEWGSFMAAHKKIESVDK